MQIQSIEGFYDSLAANYDLMTGFEQRFVKEKPFFRVIMEKFKIKSALDAGCGTGFHSLLLAQLGVEVTAVDVSDEMINRAQKHAKDLQLKLNTVKVDFENIASVIHQRFDLVLSLGNSLAHILSAESLRKVLHQFSTLTREGGILLFQNLNYDRILANREKIQSVKELGDSTFTRFYEYSGNTILFNIVTQRKRNGLVTREQQTVRLRPILKKDLEVDLKKAGFIDLQFYGGVSLSDYIEGESTDLVVIARKKEM